MTQQINHGDSSLRTRSNSKYVLVALVAAAAASAFLMPREWVAQVGQTRLSASAVSTTALALAPASEPAYAGAADWPADARVRLSAWTPVETDDLRTGVASVVASGGLLYAMGEVGSIYLSVDDGANWTQLASVAQRNHQPLNLAELQVLPAQGQRPVTFFTLAGSSWPELYRIRNGETEVITPVVTSPPFDGTVRRLAIAGQSVYAATDIGLYRSDDGGDSWSLALQTSYACGQLFSAGSTVYARCDGIFRSVNGGAFQLMSNRDELRWSQLAASAADPDVLYASTDQAIMRSADGGSSWTTTIDFSTETDPMNRSLFSELETFCGGVATGNAYGHAFAVDPNNADVVWIGKEQLFRSDDGARHFGRASVRGTFGDLPPGQQAGVIKALAFHGNGLHLATPSGVYGTANRGGAVQPGGPTACTSEPPQMAWQHERRGINAQRFGELVVSGDGSVLARMEPGLVYSDLDDPEQWLLMASFLGASGIFVDPVGGIDRFYTRGCAGGEICRWDLDTSLGAWQQTPHNAIGFGGTDFAAIDPGNRDHVFAAIGGYMVRSTDGFTTSSIAGRTVGCSGSLGAVSPADPNTVVVATQCGVFRSTNALSTSGETQWPSQSFSGGNFPVKDLIFNQDSPQRAYVVGSGPAKVYGTRDAGLTWRAADLPGANDGLPDGVVWTVVADPDASEVVYVGADAGIFVTWNIDTAGNGSRAWFQVPAPFTGAPIRKLAVRVMPDGSRRLFAFTDGAGLWTATVEITRFGDVRYNDWSYDYVKRLAAAGITNGCSTDPVSYCPQQPVLREQMAAFLLRAIHGGSYQPPGAIGYFADVPATSWAAGWIEQLRYEGVTNGCATDPALYCPADFVPREQIAVFLLRAKHGAGYQPPPATGVFADVPASSWAAAWIEQLAREGIANGCSAEPALYCPADPVTREQMAAFLVRTFNL